MTDKPLRVFETEQDILGFEYKCGSQLYLKVSEMVEIGQAVIFGKDDSNGCKVALEAALSYRDGSLIFVNSEDFDDYLNNNNIDDPMRSD